MLKSLWYPKYIYIYGLWWKITIEPCHFFCYGRPKSCCYGCGDNESATLSPNSSRLLMLSLHFMKPPLYCTHTRLTHDLQNKSSPTCKVQYFQSLEWFAKHFMICKFARQNINFQMNLKSVTNTVQYHYSVVFNLCKDTFENSMSFWWFWTHPPFQKKVLPPSPLVPQSMRPFLPE